MTRHLQELSRVALPLAIEGLEIKEQKNQTESEHNNDEEMPEGTLKNDPKDTPKVPDDNLNWFPLAKYVEEKHHWACLYPTDHKCSSTCWSTFPSASSSVPASNLKEHVRAMHPELLLTETSLFRLCRKCASALQSTPYCQHCRNRAADSWVFAYLQYKPWLALGMSDYKVIALYSRRKLAKIWTSKSPSLEAGMNDKENDIPSRPWMRQSSSDRNRRVSNVDDQRIYRRKPPEPLTERGHRKPYNAEKVHSPSRTTYPYPSSATYHHPASIAWAATPSILSWRQIG
ncbi:ankyrin repeat protein [Colletotrichum musicola]|uniref:Ankyrin repeat protein n=1 Tax=Colletotrichum musicola TaxID=2175873 RepID=A0A8H6JAY0_9PEZI|nr:ankyrin repeat protein [Colletotrichum musicola]